MKKSITREPIIREYDEKNINIDKLIKIVNKVETEEKKLYEQVKYVLAVKKEKVILNKIESMERQEVLKNIKLTPEDKKRIRDLKLPINYTQEFLDLFLLKKKEELSYMRKYKINHVLKEEKKEKPKSNILKSFFSSKPKEKEKEEGIFNRTFILRNFNENMCFDKYLNDTDYFLLKLKKSEGLKEKMIDNIENSNYEGFEKKSKIDFLRNFENSEEYLFNIIYVVQGNNLEELEEKTDKVKQYFIEDNIEAKIPTHVTQVFYDNFLYKDKYNKLILKKEEEINVLNYSKFKDEGKSTQNFLDLEILENSIIKYQNKYFDIVEIEDIDYIHAKEKTKHEIFDVYKSTLNGLNNDILLQIFVMNDLINVEKTKEQLFAKSDLPLNDSYNSYLDDNITIAAKSSTVRKIYFVISSNPDKKMDGEKTKEAVDMTLEFIEKSFQKIKANIKRLSKKEKIDIYKRLFDIDFTQNNMKVQYDEKKEKFSDYISCSSLRFKPFNSQIGRYCSKSFTIKGFPNAMRDDFMSDIMKLPFKFNLSVSIDFEELEKTIDKVGKVIFAMERTLVKKKEKKNMYISHEFKELYQESLDLREEVSNNDKKMFDVSVAITIYDETEKKVDEKAKQIDSTIRRHLFKINKLFLEQEQGLKFTLPIPYDIPKHHKRNLLSENVAMLKPFYIKNYFDPDGIFYGLSSDNNIISIDRRKYTNSSGWFLGVPGSGKSFLAKKEMDSVILRYQNDDILIIDPEAEYGILAKKYGGENIKISSNSNVRINPFDVTSDLKELTEEGEENPIKLKQEFLITFIEVLAQGLTQTEKSIVDRLLTLIYQEYIDNLKKGLVIKPTLEKFWEELSAQSEREAMALALRIEIYVKGSLNLFAGETNVEVNKRIVNFNIKELGGQLKNVALLLICDLLWQRVCKNRELKKRTWIYIDEIYLLFENEASAKFLFAFYKRVRKYGGVPTGITQNIEDLLRSETARTMLSNSAFLCILRQSSNDRELLQDLFDLSEAQADAVKNNSPGTGLILAEGNVIQFKDKMDKKSELYQLMTTKIDD